MGVPQHPDASLTLLPCPCAAAAVQLHQGQSAQVHHDWHPRGQRQDAALPGDFAEERQHLHRRGPCRGEGQEPAGPHHADQQVDRQGGQGIQRAEHVRRGGRRALRTLKQSGCRARSRQVERQHVQCELRLVSFLLRLDSGTERSELVSTACSADFHVGKGSITGAAASGAS